MRRVSAGSDFRPGWELGVGCSPRSRGGAAPLLAASSESAADIVEAATAAVVAARSAGAAGSVGKVVASGEGGTLGPAE